VLVLSKIPAWAHLSDEAYRQAVSDLVDSILEEHEEKRQAAPKDTRHLLATDPEHRPETTKRSPKPVCHAATREERKKYRQLRREFVSAYLAASEKVRKGVVSAFKLFPPGSFLPVLGLEHLTEQPQQPRAG
jgi:hypothetical protein